MKNNSKLDELRYLSGKTEAGQAVVEYVLVLAIVAAIAAAAVLAFRREGLGRKLTAPLTQEFQKTYRYGKKTVKGFEDPEGPDDHPRAEAPVGKNFRLFINPGNR